MGVETPHEKVISGPGGMDRDEALAVIAKEFAFERRGQHVWFEVPTTRGLGPIYAFAKAQRLRVLDIQELNCIPPRYHVKCVDSP